VSLNEPAFVAGTLVMQSCMGDSSYFIICLQYQEPRVVTVQNRTETDRP